MSVSDQLSCPVGGGQINEAKVRLVAGLVMLTAIAYLLTRATWAGAPALLLLLAIDFGLRSGSWARFSPFGYVADQLTRLLSVPYKATAGAPKQFAARIGLVFSVLILLLHVTGLPALLPAAALVLFAALESLAGICVGCYVYTFYLRLFPKAA